MPLPAPVTSATLPFLAICRFSSRCEFTLVLRSTSRKAERAGCFLRNRAPRCLAVLQLGTQRRNQCRGGGARRARVEGRRRVIFDTKLYLPGNVLAEELCREDARKVDSPADAAPGTASPF